MTNPEQAAAAKTGSYARFGNRALLDRVVVWLPPSGSVLDVGCASGGLLAALEGVAGHREGIEMDQVAAAAATAHADKVHAGDLQSAEVERAAFDVVVLGDVLEHLSDPAPALATAAGWVTDGGVVIVSLPNVAHWTVRAALLAGRWEYRDTGILDSTHLRFFTWRTAARLLERSGLTVLEHRPVATRLSTHLGVGLPELVERGWSRLARARPGLLAYQQILVATRR